MVVRAIKQLSRPRNGVGAYIQPCYKLVLQYCNWGGSSQGMRDFLTSKRLDKLATTMPNIQFEVLRKSGHPTIRAKYIQGQAHPQIDKVVCVRNLNIDQVENKMKLLLASSGDVLRKRVKNHNVESLNSSVRGVWSPFHTGDRYQV
ncbi:hypothetical protein TBLA_0F01770 [Henningerozyma blattae CBS 6284]|uniref:Large ribosomal subunit protein mL43 n=1 Tax=Henningerozyma blattae (strain ATCC 34711 / CBS 6284 / DSM 70876 / NBRC 10599 / NRRL Y-10934 / UCD 77-7) TaxID=1071380 RepID=I2H5R7_HENB6|nr:hypothetical protein TBLA_0F01770 [Tetrapisispora blattae CBS 6284]CCH61719.1 hypothetical protein TBLA_0F01770 [Tetrapisispora blattae CBS 6284]